MRLVTAALVLALATLAACAGENQDPADAATDTAALTTDACAEARRSSGWCEAGQVGYVASLEMTSELLHEVLDTHGHLMDAAAVTCEECLRQLPVNGYCEAHGMGFVDNKAYMSRLTYHLALGKTIDPAALACPVCRRHTHSSGWCPEHQIGFLGNVAIREATEFAEVEQAYALVRAAIEMSATCQWCGAAMIANGYCPTHRLHYKDGRPVIPPAPAMAPPATDD